MTYCAAICLQEGIVFTSDTRTNAGVDHISTFKKMFSYGIEGERFICIMTAGNLATSQAVINRLEYDIQHDAERNLYNLGSLYDIAHYLGEYASSIARQSQITAMQQNQPGFGSTFLVGGQIQQQPPEVYMIYNEGNCIHTTADTPFLQIGESKYGKPILDRAIKHDSSLDDAIRASLVSFDSTIRSNLSVGFPIDLLVYQTDSLAMPKGIRLDEHNQYLQTIRSTWSNGLIDILHRFDLPPADYRA
ncbi:peptidase [Chelonobacter oris]|uniref:Peptidase n=1 Tax=Chelonobacter oris TaxID=505317 RepID=A0A0A3AM80_9PAST|nr:peptidase [Chelonobacter oris]KGQ70451.1 peptidase [Chelonobacter oris]